MKIGKNKLQMSSGEVRKFGSEQKRNNFERVAEAVKHGFKPHGKSHHPIKRRRGHEAKSR